MPISRRHDAHAWWMSVLIIGGILAGVYFAWPPFAVYMGKSTMATVLRKNSMTCFQYGKEKCIEDIVQSARKEGIVLEHAGVNVLSVARGGVRFDINYRAELKYPLTGTMFGDGKKRYKRVHLKTDVRMGTSGFGD